MDKPFSFLIDKVPTSMRLVKALKENKDGLTVKTISNSLDVDFSELQPIVIHFTSKGLIDVINENPGDFDLEPTTLLRISKEGFETVK